METQEIFKRLRIGLALVVGFVTGKLVAANVGHHASEFFIGGFGVGVVLTQFLFYVADSFSRKDGST